MQLQSDSCPMEPMAMIYTYIIIATVGNTIQTVNSPMRIWVFMVPQRRKELHTATTDSTKLSVSTLLSQRIIPLWQALGRRSMGRYTGATRMCCGNPEGRGRVGKTNKLIGGCGLFVPLLWQGSYFHIASEAILFKLFIAFFNQIAKLDKNLYIYIYIYTGCNK